MTTFAHDEADSTAQGGVTCNELTKYGCQLPERNRPSETSVQSDFTMVPVLIAVLPALPEPLLLSSMRRVVEAAAPVTFTPLHVPLTVLQV